MKSTFKREWLKEIPNWSFDIPRDHNFGNFVNWVKRFYIEDKNLISSFDANFGKVYDVGEGLAAKVFRNTPFIKNERIFNDEKAASKAIYFLEREFEMTKLLREAGINVPREEGLFLTYNKVLKESRPAFVMERINFVNYTNKLCMGDFQKINLLRREELDKAENAGFVLGEDAEELRNSLLSKKDGKVYLIDFMFWGIK